MTPSEAVILDWLMERGYTREQAARALVALTLPEPDEDAKERERSWLERSGTAYQEAPAELTVEAERRGYLPKPEGT